MRLRIITLIGLMILPAQGLVADAAGPVRKDALGDPLPKGAMARLGTCRLRQSGIARSVAFSPVGKYLASCDGYGQAVRLWDRATGKEVLRRDLPAGERDTAIEVTGLNRYRCYSPDGKFLATENAILNRNDLSVKFQLKAKGHAPRSMALSPDGKLLATGGGSGSLVFRGENTILLWNTATGKSIGKLEGHRESVQSLAFSPDGKTLTSASLDRTIRFWDVAKRRQVRQIEDGTDLPVQIAYSPDGRILAAVYHVGPGHLRFWNSANGKPIRLLPDCRGFVKALAFSPNGNLLLVGGIGHTIQLWNLKTGKQVFAYPGHESAVFCVRFSPDGKMLASRGADRTVRLWDRATGKEVRVLRGHDEGFLAAFNIHPPDGTVAWSPDGKTVAATDATSTNRQNLTLYLWDVASGKIKAEINERTAPRGVAFAPDGETLATTAGNIQLWSVRSQAKRRELGSSRGVVRTSVVFFPDGETIALGGRLISLWNWTNGRLLREIPAHPRGFVRLACSRGGQILLSGGEPRTGGHEDRTACLWETASGTLIRGLKSPQARHCVALSPNGRLAAFTEHYWSASEVPCEAVVLWDMVNGRELTRFKGHEGGVYSLDFSPDGSVLASGGTDTTILLWDVSGFRAKLPATSTDAKTLAQLWAELEGREAAKPYQALWALVGAGDEAVKMLGRHLRPALAPDANHLRKLVANLDDNDFDLRAAAVKELTRLGPLALPALRRALAAKPKIDLRRRLQDIVEQIETRPATGADLRQVRALHALEQIGSPAARRLLKELAKGAEGAALTRDAQAALTRLERFPARK